MTKQEAIALVDEMESIADRIASTVDPEVMTAGGGCIALRLTFASLDALRDSIEDPAVMVKVRGSFTWKKGDTDDEG